MAKSKSAIKCDKTNEKSVVRSKEKLINLKTARKQIINKEGELLDGVDSLVFLKDTKETKKFNDIDDRISLLKSELKSLIGGTKLSKDCGIQDKNALRDVQTVEEKSDMGCNKVLKNLSHICESKISAGEEFKPSFSSTPCKFTEWLDTIIIDASDQCQIRTGKSYHTNGQIVPSELETNTFDRIPPSKVEELLYKTFVIQNYGVHLSDLSGSDSKVINSKTKTTHETGGKSKKTCRKSSREKPLQTKKNKHCNFLNRGRKKRIVSVNTSQSEVEVINIDSTLPESEIVRMSPLYTDVDVNTYDWDEPFDVNSDSDVQVINDSEAKGADINDKGVPLISTEHMEINENSDISKLQQKKLWECPVCFEQSKGQEIVATQCGHVFCKACIENHTSRFSSNCPTCRADLTNKPFITLFNF